MDTSTQPEALSSEEARRIAPYVTNADQSVFALRNLPPEVYAYLFARYSRSREGVRRMLLAMLDDSDAMFPAVAAGAPEDDAALADALAKARAFAEKWIAGYGHKSPAEDAPLHLCFEGASILFSKVIEDFRLTSPQEKSTRYVVFPREGLYRPRFHDLNGKENRALNEAVSDHLDRQMTVYAETIDRVLERCRGEYEREDGQSERGYATLLQTKACDLCRYLLPVAVQTSFGIFANAREWEYIVSRLLSHELPEARAIGEAVHDEASKIAPTLIRYAARNPYYAALPARIGALASELFGDTTRVRTDGSPRRHLIGEEHDEAPLCRILSHDPEAEAHLAAAILYPRAGLPYEDLVRRFAGTAAAVDRERVIDASLSDKGPYDVPPRAFENAVYRIEFTCDYGAYRDLQRHRIGTSIDPILTPSLGASLPDEIVDWGLQDVFLRQFGESAALWRRVVEETGDEAQAQYVLPMMTSIRFFRVWNLRQVMNVVRLRSARQGHVSYRRVAQALHREVTRVHPLLARYIEVDSSQYALAREGTPATR